MVIPNGSVKPPLSFGSTMGWLRLPLANRSKPWVAPLALVKLPTMVLLSLIFQQEVAVSPGTSNVMN